MGSMLRIVARTVAATALLALAGVVAAQSPVHGRPGDWSQGGFGPHRKGYNPHESLLSVDTAPGLQQTWAGSAGADVNGGAVVANGKVFVQNNDGRLVAFRASCVHQRAGCAPVWQSDLPYIPVGSQYATPAVAGKVVYFYSDRLYAFDTDCGAGGATCAPKWIAWLGPSIYSSSPVIGGGGFIYVAADILIVFRADCGSGGSDCDRTWASVGTAGPLGASPALGDAAVYVAGRDGRFYAFPKTCAERGCLPLWAVTLDNGGFEDRVNTPSVAGGLVFIAMPSGKLYAFPETCTPGHCAPAWTATVGGHFFSSTAVAYDTVYVGSDDGHLYAYPAHCRTDGGECAPRWIGAVAGAIDRSTPAVANGVVYVTASAGSVYAFPARCGDGGASCAPLWVGDGGEFNASSPAVADGVLYTGSRLGKVLGFTVPAAP
ncbi:MAG TPA: PQQ-binding-like beta-propeller repeat protein [Ideonella sp.]|nr:PQQ-binding-like beta-propeller repeat protein [Ideonella sp.]